MALLHDRHSQPPNKEPEWSSICNQILDQYLDTDELFGSAANGHGRSSSNNSLNLFDFSGESEQSHRTDVASPLPGCESLPPTRPERPQQPKAQEPVDFWKKTLHALEQNAAECDLRQRKLRSSKSHPDFLSLGGYPSPPAVPSSPTPLAFYTPQRLPKAAANGKRRSITSRSLSRGRPTGITKAAAATLGALQATLRQCSASPSKMVKAKGLWMDRVHADTNDYHALPSAHATSVALMEDNSSAFEAARPAGHEDYISPLTNTFHQTHLHTPNRSAAVNYRAHAHNSAFDTAPRLPQNSYQITTIGANDTAPLYPERASSPAVNSLQGFDFGFSPPPGDVGWPSPAPLQAMSLSDPFVDLPPGVLPSIEPCDSHSAGLDISCDPCMLSGCTTGSRLMALPSVAYGSAYMDNSQDARVFTPSRLPNTPRNHRRARSYRRSLSLTPPATEPRRSTRKTSSSSRRASSRHARAKSTNSTPRRSHTIDKASFVNFTPEDSSRILSGVAPSGSSKTKARREKEAADKRRRLSQAAIRAVTEAGGDVDVLSRAGLLI